MIKLSLDMDDSIWKKMKKQALSSNKEILNLGFFPEDRYGSENDNLPVAQVAQWNEEGTTTNPTRPFMRVGFGGPLKKGIYNKTFKESIERIVSGASTFKQEYKYLGVIFVDDLKEVIEQWDTPPNSPRTIEEKGFNNPLVDTGLMYESVKYKIEKEGSD